PIHNEGNLQLPQNSPQNLQQNLQQNNRNINTDSRNRTINRNARMRNFERDIESQQTQQTDQSNQSVNDDNDYTSKDDNDSRSGVSSQDADMDDSVDSSLEIIRERAIGLNGAYFRKKSGGKYKHDSYRALGSDNSYKNIDKQFKVTDVTKNYSDRFVPVDESDG